MRKRERASSSTLKLAAFFAFLLLLLWVILETSETEREASFHNHISIEAFSKPITPRGHEGRSQRVCQPFRNEKSKKAANQVSRSYAYVVKWQTADSTWSCLMFVFKGGTRKVLSFATNPRSFYFFSLAKMKGEIYIKRSHKRVGGKMKEQKECQPTDQLSWLSIWNHFFFAKAFFLCLCT